MKHNCNLTGYGYRLRPVKLSDAQTIIDIRLEDAERNRYIHTISRDVAAQETWLEQYFRRPGDYYFVVENVYTAQPEGLISFYDEKDGKAEWGRWVIKKGSLAALESVYLLYRIAFEQIGLRELYCRTLSENTGVVSFHQSIGEETRAVLKDFFELDGKLWDATEQYADRDLFYSKIAPDLERRSKRVARRSAKQLFGGFTSHHSGIATRSIDREFPIYALMGYEKEGPAFEDVAQGIRGQFIVGDGLPCLELLENLPGSHTLDIPLERGQKNYHMAFYVTDFDKAIEVCRNNRAKIISQPVPSVYFGKRICFLLLPNMQMIELLER